MKLDHQTGLVVQTHSTSMIDEELLGIINKLGRRCYVNAQRIDHPVDKINSNVIIESLGKISHESLVDICIKHFPKGVKRVLFYDVKSSEIASEDFRDFDPEIYMKLNPDIVSGGFNTPELAYKHWITYGKAEGRPHPALLPNDPRMKASKNYRPRYKQVSSSAPESNKKYKRACVIFCNETYLAQAIVSLKLFCHHNPGYVPHLLARTISPAGKKELKANGIKLILKDLSKDFNNLNKRPYGQQYPLECFYRFYVPVALKDYDYTVCLEPDIVSLKPLNVDLNNIKLIGGSTSTKPWFKIQQFNAINKDLSKIVKFIDKFTNNINIEQYRLIGGVTIFNNRAMNRVNFYKKMVELYRLSWKYNCPRCGDDSLFVLYQMLYPRHFTLYTNQLMSTHSQQCTEIENITYFHAMGENTKFWTRSKPISELNRYANQLCLQFLYNNFSLNFIKKYLPDIYVDYRNIKLNFWHWTRPPNFGDLITQYFLDNLNNATHHSIGNNENINPRLLAVGSIYRLANNYTIVYGSGVRDKNQSIEYSETQFTRGPLTRDLVLKTGRYCPPVYGDLALLLPFFYKPTNIKKKYTIGIVPHVNDYDRVVKMYSNKSEQYTIINLKTGDIEKVIQSMLQCDKIISSSLHGLICADAYNIPNTWVKYSDTIKGDDTKFHDYFKSVSRKNNNFTDQRPGTSLIPLEGLEKLNYNHSIKFDSNKLWDVCFFDKNKNITPYTKYLFSTLQSKYLTRTELND